MKRILLAALLAGTFAATLAAGQTQIGCPGGRCPLPGSDMRQFGQPGELSREAWQGSVEEGQWRPPRSAPPWLVHVFGASGTLIYRDDQHGLVATAYHVVRGAPRDGLRVQFPDGRSYTGRVCAGTDDLGDSISVDKNWDVALILIPRPDAEPCPPARVAPQPGDTVYLLGYGGGRYRTATGKVSRYIQTAYNAYIGREVRNHERETMYVSPGMAIGGDSGGAYVNADGQFCGVISCGGRGSSDSSWGPSVRRVHALCSDEGLQWPWELPYRRRTRERIEDGESQIDGLEERLRGKADRSELEGIKQPSTEPAPPGQDPFTSVLLLRINEYKAEVDGLQTRIIELEGVAEAAKRIADEVQAGTDKTLQELVTEVREAKQNATQAQGVATQAAEEAAQAAEGIREVPNVVADVAEKVAQQAVEEAEPDLLEQIKTRVTEGVVATTFGKVKGWLFGTWAGIGVLVVVGGLVLLDVYKKLRYGDPLFVQHLTERLKGAAEATPLRIDDRVAAHVDAAIDGLADGLEKRLGPYFGNPPKQG